GYSPEEALDGLDVEALVPERLKERHRAGLSRYHDTGHGPYVDSRAMLDLPAVRKGGEEIWVELTLSPIEPLPETGTEGRFVLAVVRDVTERRRVEEEVRKLNEELEGRVAERTARLESVLAELKERESVLRESEERFRLLVQGVRDYAIFMLDPEGRVASWNEGARRIKGYEVEEILGRHFSVFYPDGEVERGHPEEELRIAAEEGAYEEEGLRVRKDGSRFWASVLITALQDGKGNLRGFAKVTRDVTERKRAEEALRQSEERHRAVVEQAHEGIFLFAPETKRILEANPAFQRMFGYDEEELRETTLYELVPQDPEGVDRNVERALLGQGHLLVGERVYRRKDGSSIDVEVSGGVISYGGEEVICSVVRDVTERKRAEEALRRQAELLDLSHEPIFAWELGGGIVYWNRGSEELYGFSREEAVGSDNHRLLRTVHPMPREHIEAALEREGRWDGELVHTTKDRRRVVTESRHMLVETSDGRRLVLETNRDVTERKRSEEAMAEVREAERRRIARDMHDGVLQDISHALAEAQVLRMIPEEQGRERLDLLIEALRRSARELRGAVYDLRQEEDAPGRSFVRSVESLVELNRQMNQGWEVELTVDPRFPEGLPEREGKELLRVVQEALSNARKHSGAEHVRVALRTEGDDVVAEVEDDGRGFDPGPTRAGVGLRSMDERAATLGGKLEVEGEPGKGTRVRLRTPLKNVGGGGAG
ncbi:MAG: hypothetical protein CYG60_01600, partial [Actinobacteria bacterium]